MGTNEESKIYLIIGQRGDYEDLTTWVEAAFRNPIEAENEAKKLNDYVTNWEDRLTIPKEDYEKIKESIYGERYNVALKLGYSKEQCDECEYIEYEFVECPQYIVKEITIK